MKLYTEEQVKRAIDIADDNADLLEYNEILFKLKPIQLPSDEEMQNEAAIYDGLFCDFDFIEGAKWVIEQIKQQNNGECISNK